MPERLKYLGRIVLGWKILTLRKKFGPHLGQGGYSCEEDLKRANAVFAQRHTLKPTSPSGLFIL